MGMFHPKTMLGVQRSLRPTYSGLCDLKTRPMVSGQFGGKRTDGNTTTVYTNVPARLQPATMRDYMDTQVSNDINASVMFFPSRYKLDNLQLITFTEPDLGDFEVLHSYTDVTDRMEAKALVTKKVK